MIVSFILFLIIAVFASIIDHAAMPAWCRCILSVLGYAAVAFVVALVPIIFPTNLSGPVQFLAQTPVFVMSMLGIWYGGYYLGERLLNARHAA